MLVVLKAKKDVPALRLVQSILSGPIDIDKMDYLDRDSLHAGVPYGRNFDKNRLIQSLLVNEAGDGLAISAKGKTAAPPPAEGPRRQGEEGDSGDRATTQKGVGKK